MVGNNSHPNASLKHNDPLSANTNVCKGKPNQPPMHQSSLGLSPPPMQQGIQTAPQPYYQPSQFGGMSAIPSPPAVLYNSSPMPSQFGHYERFIASAHYGAAGNAGKNLIISIYYGLGKKMFLNVEITNELMKWPSFSTVQCTLHAKRT